MTSLLARNVSRLSYRCLGVILVPSRTYKNPSVSEFYRQHSIERIEEKKRLLGPDVLPVEVPTELTEVEESTAEWKFVERLIPPQMVPVPPKQDSYPTPSGWQPPPEKSPDPRYNVRRHRLLTYGVELHARKGQTQLLTTVRFIEGDIWALQSDLRHHLEELTGKTVLTQVHELAGLVRFKGDHVNAVKQWLARKGF